MRPDKLHLQKIYKLGAFLMELRVGLGLSIREAAARAQITPPYLAKIEKGFGITSIGVVVLVNLANTFRIPVSTILKEAGFIASADEQDGFPDFATYLRKKYRCAPQAIRDLEMAKEIVDKKYNQLSSPPPNFREVMSNFLNSFICRSSSRSLLSMANFFCSKK